MEYLIAAGTISLLFGLLLLFAPIFLGNLGAICNRVLIYLDEKLEPVKVWIGITLIIVGGWLLYVSANYPEVYYLPTFWIICFVFGLLFLFFPHWLSWLSNISNRVIFSTDEVVMGARKLVGIVLLIIGIYIFYMVYVIMQST
ncbi:hypothetical protein AMJ44_02120 [candidate division WOR-1 bacterium DG_54_3]|uniref:Uncharacterized protein n=1 Tax=candidate division WOR-1 bacterium DG_54_3 TaxID=1703775 RepID=A0A0S7Y556_UNCSA|nr:MAG: hypothetical protein AMJ44_02120 [candidate division WOR-1 bacterium DG_54_3]